MTFPPIESSALQALNAGFDRLNKASVELTSSTDLDPPSDSVELSQASLNAASDPMLAGVMDLMKSKVQVGAAAMLLRVYGKQQTRLLDMFNDSGSDHTS